MAFLHTVRRCDTGVMALLQTVGRHDNRQTCCPSVTSHDDSGIVLFLCAVETSANDPSIASYIVKLKSLQPSDIFPLNAIINKLVHNLVLWKQNALNFSKNKV